MAPREAFELWMQRQQGRKADETLASYRYRVRPFIDWLEDCGIDNLNDLSGRDILRFDAERQERDVQQNTLNNQFGTIRLFLSFCADIDAVDEELPKTVDPPLLSKDDRVNTEKLPSERATRILDRLSTYAYAGRDHVIMLLLWRTTARLGAVRGLDLEDLYLDEDAIERLRYQDDLNVGGEVIDEILGAVDPPFIYFRHRPDTGTPLKNGYGGERPVNISEDVAEVLRAYIDVNRVDVDEGGRQPLLTTEKGDAGRISKSGIRQRVYILTQPCRFGGDCPHDREIETCEAREHGHESKCPSSRSPHRLRTGSITWHRDRGWPPEVLAEKANTSVQMINAVYDQPEQLKRMATRRSYLDNLDSDT
jgi:site-specific recombinase XerD